MVLVHFRSVLSVAKGGDEATARKDKNGKVKREEEGKVPVLRR